MATTARVKAKAKTGHSESEPRSTSSPGTTPAPLLRAPDSLLASRSPRIVVRRQMVDSRVAADEEDAFSGNAALAGGAGVSTTVEAGTTILAPSAASLVDAIVAPPLGAPEPTPPETAALPATETASGEVAAVEGAPIESAAATATREVATPVPVAIAGGVAASPGTNGAVELLMPPPPERLSAAEEQRLAAVQSRVGATGSAAAAMPPAESQVGEARSAVEEPETETQARAEGALVAALEQRPAPSPEIEELCERIYRIIRAKRPPDEESLVDAEPDEMARAAGGQLDSAVQGDVNRVGSSYDELQQEPSGTPQQQPQAMTEVPTALTGPSINASTATPTGVAAEAVSLDADVTASQQRLDEAGMTSDTAALIQDPANPVVQARETQGELEETAERGPAEVMAEQQSALGGARADMAALQQRALASLQQSRTATVQGTRSQQTEMVGSETEMRTQISTRAQEIINQARTDVQDLLRPLPETARNMWERGVAVLSTEFEQDLARVKRWIDERHSGVGGAFLSVADYLTGLPDWVTEEYDRAEQAFGDGVCDLLREISTEVNAVIAAAEAIIANANQDVDDLFSNLPVELQEWAAGERERIDGQLNDLHNQVQATQNDINRELTESASGAVQQVRERIHQLRQEAGGLLGRLADMVNRFLDDPIKFIIDGLLSLVGIAPASFWALVNRIQQVISDIADDPLGFAQNLLSAIGQGFQQFFDKFSEHLMAGFWDWLFSGLGSVGVEIPSDFSLKSIITFILQLLGITWDRIRRLLAKHIGEENVALIEKAWELVSTLIEMGPEGIFEMIKEQLNPQEILNQILQAAIDYLIETLIRQVTVRVVMLFNPVGAVVQAIEAIYKVLKWLFENAARIFSLIETVVNGMADIVAGNIGGMANAVESALARLIAPVIDFIAGLVGLGDLPNKIADTIKGLQGWIEGILDRVIGWLAGQARRLLQAVGIGGEEEGAEGTAEGQLEANFMDSDGSPHELTVILTAGQPDIKVASSTPTGVQHQIEERRNAETDTSNPRPLTPQQKGALTRAWNQHDELVALSRRYLAADDTQKPALQGEMQRLMNSLAGNMVRGDAWPDTEIQPTQVDFSSPGGNKQVVANPLTRRPGNTVGSAAADVIPGWQANIPPQTSGRGGTLPWRRVHLLSDRLHGPGNDPANLIPAQEITNGEMRRGPEREAYARIIRGETLEYTARVTGADPTTSFFPAGVHVMIIKIAPGERETIFNGPITIAPAPTLTGGPQLTPTQTIIVDTFEQLEARLGRRPTLQEVATERGLASKGHVSDTIAQIRDLLRITAQPHSPEFQRAARILRL